MVTVGFLLAYVLAPLLTMSDTSAWAAARTLLAAKHKTAGIECAGCHDEAPPKGKVAQDKCVQCHGDYGKVAEKTKEVTPNPHASHVEDLQCGKCHRMHKPSVDYCAQCHKFGFKVP